MRRNVRLFTRPRVLSFCVERYGYLSDVSINFPQPYHKAARKLSVRRMRRACLRQATFHDYFSTSGRLGDWAVFPVHLSRFS